MNRLKTILLTFWGISALASAQLQETYALIDSINARFARQVELFPQEKMYIQTDRSDYLPGDSIWLKAYVVDAMKHQPVGASSFVYVDCVNPSDSVIGTVKIKADSLGMYYGVYPLSEGLIAGDYSLYGYTNYMRNLDSDYLFSRTIHLLNPLNASCGTEMKESFIQSPVEKEDFDVSFFPEGGHLVNEVTNVIAFKSLNEAGWGEAVSGKVWDDTGAVKAIFNDYYRYGELSLVSGSEAYVLCGMYKPGRSYQAIYIADG